MLTYIALLLVVGMIIYYVSHYVKYEMKARSLIRSGRDLYLKDIIIFPNEELARRIKNELSAKGWSINIIYFNNRYITLNPSDTKKQILYEIECIQNFLIDELDKDPKVQNSAIEDNIDKIMLDIWLDYGYKEKYRAIFKREMYEMLESEEISNSTFNRMCRRFYNFDRSEYKVEM